MLMNERSKRMHTPDSRPQSQINPEGRIEQPEVSLEKLRSELEQEFQKALHSDDQLGVVSMGPFIENDAVNFFTSIMQKILSERYPRILARDTAIDGEVRTTQRKDSGSADYDEHRYLMILHIQSSLDDDSLDIAFNYEFTGDGVSPNVQGLSISSAGDETDFFKSRNMKCI